MRTMERTFKIDRNLARRAETKFRRYGTSIEGVLAVLVSLHGMPKELRPSPPPVPSVIEFDAQGEHFVADVTPDEDRYFAQVRGYPGCFTEGGNEEELRKYLVEVTELVVFDMGEVTRNPDGNELS